MGKNKDIESLVASLPVREGQYITYIGVDINSFKNGKKYKITSIQYTQYSTIDSISFLIDTEDGVKHLHWGDIEKYFETNAQHRKRVINEL